MVNEAASRAACLAESSGVRPRRRSAPARPKPLAPGLSEALAIRRARLADVPALLAMINEAFSREKWLIPGPRITRDELVEEVTVETVTLLVAEVSGKVTGCVHLRERPSGGEVKVSPELGLLAVAPRAQGRGFGPALVREAEHEARRRGSSGIFLRCARELGMETYYEALGYETVGVAWGRHLGATRPFHLVTMSKSLGGRAG